MDERIGLILNKFDRLDHGQKVMMLDALYQWASAPTGVTAVNKGYPPNHGLIKSNLKLRYGLTDQQAQDTYSILKTEIEAVGFEFDTGYLEAEADIEDYFIISPILRDAVLERLKTAPLNMQYVTWLFLKTKNQFNISPTTSYGSANFAALLDAGFCVQITNLRQQVIEPLIKLGFLNELEWVGSKIDRDRSKRRLHIVFPKCIEPLVTDIDQYMILPELPDFRAYVDAVFKRRRVIGLVGLEELLAGLKDLGCEGMAMASDIVDQIIPQPYLIGKWQSVLAINHRIYNDMKRHFFEKKTSNIEIKDNIHRALDQLREQYYPDISCRPVDLFPGTLAWEIHTVDKTLSAKDILVFLAPWVTKAQIETLHKEASTKLVAIFTTMMEISDLNETYRKTYQTDIQGVDWVVIDTTRTPFVERAVGIKPRLLSELLNMLGLQQDEVNEPAKAMQQVTAKVQVLDNQNNSAARAGVAKGEVTMSPTSVQPLAQLELGHRASVDELRSLMGQSGLEESERREKLTSKGVFYYPLSIAATHTAIFGTNNSGKSTTTKRLVNELVRNHVPVLVLDWHDEYHALIKGLGGTVSVPPTATMKPAPDEKPFTWNILDPHFYAAEITPAVIEDYIGIVVDLLAPKGLMGLTDPMKGGLGEALKLAYKSSTTPTFASILDVIEHVSIPPTTADALRRRIRTFCTGSLGSIFGNSATFDPQEVFNKPVCIRVKHLTVDHESAVGLLMFFVLRQVESHFKRMEKGKEAGQARVRHVCVIDEAPMAMGSNPRVKKEVVRMLQELRGFGVGLVLVCRNTRIGDDILGETNQKIAHRLDVPSDVNKVAAMLELKEKDLLHRLPPGVAFARVAGNPTALVRITPT